MNLIPGEKLSIEKIEPNSLYLDRYSEEEKNLLAQLKKLFDDWHKLLSEHDENVSFDGFYPGYLKQKVKLLFIGRENRNFSDGNYLEGIYKATKEKEGWLLGNNFHTMMLYLAYAFQKGEFEWEKILEARDLVPKFGTDELSFAFMNLSKFSNESENSEKVDWNLVTESAKISTQNEKGRNFIYEEIVLLDPDVVITMNLMEHWRDVIADEERTKRIETDLPSDAVTSYELKLDKKPVLLLDTYHFSARKGPRETFFDPIIEAVKKYNSLTRA